MMFFVRAAVVPGLAYGIYRRNIYCVRVTYIFSLVALILSLNIAPRLQELFGIASRIDAAIFPNSFGPAKAATKAGVTFAAF